MKYAVLLSLVSFVPYLAYCLLRLAVVGHFGLISFGGYQLAGLAVEMLDNETVEEQLPERFRPLGREILKERAELGMHGAFSGRYYMNLRQYEDNFCKNIYQVAVPIAKRIYGDDNVLFNNELTAFSKSVVWLHKKQYMIWMAESLPRAAAKLLYRYWFIWLFLPATVLLAVFRWMKMRQKGKRLVLTPNYNTHFAVNSMLWLAVSYFFCSEMVVIASGTYGDSRFTVAAGVFVPSLIALIMLREFDLLGRIRQTTESSTA
jgi:hypothetical protein